MPASAPTEPVQDSVSKVNDELAVGSDLEFQRRWWKFERGVWIFFILLIVLDVLGVFAADLSRKPGCVQATARPK